MAALCLNRMYVAALHRALASMFPAVASAHLIDAYAAALGRPAGVLSAGEQATAAESWEVALLDDVRFFEVLARYGYREPRRPLFDTFDLASRYQADPMLPEAGEKSRHSRPEWSLKAIGADDPDLYYFCRVLQNLGVELPGLLSMPAILPSLRAAGREDKRGFLTVDLREQAQIWGELEEWLEEDDSEIGAPVADGSYVGVVSFSAETGDDLKELFRQLSKRYPARWAKKTDPDDMHVELELKAPLTISALYQVMLEVEEGRYMRETLRAVPAARNSFERRIIEAAPRDWANLDVEGDVEGDVDAGASAGSAPH